MKRILQSVSVFLLCAALSVPVVSASDRGRNHGGGNGVSNSSGSFSRPGSMGSGGKHSSGSFSRPSSSSQSDRFEALRNSTDKRHDDGGRPGSQGSSIGSQRPGNNPGDNHAGNQRPGGSVGDQFNRPGNNLAGNQRPGGNASDQFGRPGSIGSNRPGGAIDNQVNRPGNNHVGDHRPGNNHVGDHRPGNNHVGDHRPGNNHVGDHHRPGGNHVGDHHRPGGNPPSSHRPPMPPHPGISNQRPYRPLLPPPRPYYRPVPPPSFHYYRPITPLQAILGITFGTAMNATLNHLLNSGYTVQSYTDDAVYITNAKQLNMIWPNATLYYSNGGMIGSEFIYSTGGYDMSRYELCYSRLVDMYGIPYSTESISGGVKATWWTSNKQFITLSYISEYASNGSYRYYTLLSYGI